MKSNIMDEWASVKVPPPPELKKVTVDSKQAALLVLDIQNQNCNKERRPRCVASIPKIRSLLSEARSKRMLVVFSLARNANVCDIRKEVAPLEGEQVVRSGVDKFFGTDLEKILKDKNIETLVLTGTSAHGAVLHTATGAALRHFRVIVPIGGISAGTRYAEQYTTWHLANAPGSRRQVTLTRVDLIRFCSR